MLLAIPCRHRPVRLCLLELLRHLTQAALQAMVIRHCVLELKLVQFLAVVSEVACAGRLDLDAA